MINTFQETAQKKTTVVSYLSLLRSGVNGAVIDLGIK